MQMPVLSHGCWSTQPPLSRRGRGNPGPPSKELPKLTELLPLSTRSCRSKPLVRTSRPYKPVNECSSNRPTIPNKPIRRGVDSPRRLIQDNQGLLGSNAALLGAGWDNHGAQYYAQPYSPHPKQGPNELRTSELSLEPATSMVPGGSLVVGRDIAAVVVKLA